ncbi:MAG: hypothetical protein XE06_0912 [Anaerolineaceae bacterium 46_22]|nr:MAG: hypothetical protein XE06_0912 [Anaerolineaceae bacterium 46_22]
MNFMKRFRGWWLQKIKKQPVNGGEIADKTEALNETLEAEMPKSPGGTYVQKLTAALLIQALEGRMDYEILVWRSVNVRFLRSVIYPDWGGR